MLYDIEVRPGSNTEFFNYYTETVEANSSHDAVARVQRANPGCDVRCTNSYNSDFSSGGSSGGDATGLLLLGGVLFVLYYVWNAIAQFAQFSWQIILSVIDWIGNLISWFPFQLAVGSIFIFFFVILIASIDD